MPPRKSTHRSQARFLARVLPGAGVAPFPPFSPPRKGASNAQWLRLHLTEGRPRFYDASGSDRTADFAKLAAAARELPANNLVLIGTADAAAQRFAANDIVYLDGFSLAASPIAGRRRVLAAFLTEAPRAFTADRHD